MDLPDNPGDPVSVALKYEKFERNPSSARRIECDGKGVMSGQSLVWRVEGYARVISSSSISYPKAKALSGICACMRFYATATGSTLLEAFESPHISR